MSATNENTKGMYGQEQKTKRINNIIYNNIVMCMN